MSNKSQTNLLKAVCKRAELMRAPYRQSSWTSKTCKINKKTSFVSKTGVNSRTKVIDSHGHKLSSSAQQKKEPIDAKEVQQVNDVKDDLNETANSNNITKYLKEIHCFFYQTKYNMSYTQADQPSNNNNNNNDNLYWQLIRLLDINENGRFVLPFSRRLILIDRSLVNEYENIDSDQGNQNDTSYNFYNTESEFSSSLSEHYFLTDDENGDDDNEYGGSSVSISLPPSPFAYDPYDSYDWES